MKKRILCLALSISLLFSLSSCEQSETQSHGNKSQYEDIILPEQPYFDVELWESLKENLAEMEAALERNHTYVITYSTDLEYNNSVGNEWRYGVRYNDEYIASSSKIVIPDSSTNIDLVAFATEIDDRNDKGTTRVAFDALKAGQKQTKWATVIVRENNGRYKGNTAKWYFEITIERI